MQECFHHKARAKTLLTRGKGKATETLGIERTVEPTQKIGMLGVRVATAAKVEAGFVTETVATVVVGHLELTKVIGLPRTGQLVEMMTVAEDFGVVTVVVTVIVTVHLA